ncbi:hypothetical protein Srot_0858 [Segniliparus rotundus DSM 44985]|jgi:transcriptional regulator with XRE-family HTH domain|uniref:HTH cro/C1-type domain-containing protein n=1 Tax=Segniliparus rotundus (strain ATCC BAA-972 / CDC 1076 / CIP 108378 / DSM 44985 / JCM 13578) TaxID=640132 RepID=D6ZE55_SEGRD|nr:hypothetical protein [Segniliparus rotundus]ADG97335.1 hypothetical protein Srot_0858 [Segniliparus rotundus DSM 44985]
MVAKIISPEVLRELIKARGAKQCSLARRAHCSEPLVSMLANGRRSTCLESVAAAIEIALRMPRGAIFDYVDDIEGGIA